MRARAAALLALLVLAGTGCSGPSPSFAPPSVGFPTTPAPTAPAPMAGVPEPTAAPPALRFGVLAATCDPARAAAEKAAGLDTAMIELSWDRYQPAPEQFDPGYAEQFRTRLAACRAAGLQVVLGLGLQYPPPWVLELGSGRFVDQFGSRSRLGEANLVFSQDVRAAAEGYLRRIATDLDLREVAAVRIGTSRTGELGYPGPADGDGGGNHDYWGFDTAAQTGTGLAAGSTVTPMPGWRPGDHVWQGRPVTDEQTTAWFRWYTGALTGALAWQVDVLRGAGFGGEFHVPTPGRGVLPADLAAALAGRLDGRGDPDGNLERGQDYPQQFRALAELDARLRGAVPPSRVVVDFTGLDDITAVRARSDAQDTCRPDDPTDLLTRAGVPTWSNQRWTLALARSVGLAAVGENPGPPAAAFTGGENDSDQVPDQLRRGVGYAHDCGLERFLFAFEEELFAGTSGVTVDDYARLVAEPR